MAGQIEGRNPVLEALKSGRPISRILILDNVGRHSTIADILHLSKQRGIPVEWVPAEVIKRKSMTGSSQGVIATTSAKGYIDIRDLFDITRSKNEPAFYVVLDGLEDPHNLGAIIRTCDAAGVHGVIIPERRAVGLTETVAKVSAGAIEYVPVARVSNLNNAIKILKDSGVWVLGIDQGSNKSFYEFDLKLPVALVIGGEGKGISRLVKDNCDEIVSIPMKGNISSLNASVAAAIIMYEVAKQRISG